MPTISVIVPVYNVEKYLHCCVDSILAQTFTDIEVLLVDDGSTDSSGSICDEYAQKDSRVRVFHKENGGVSSARNLGLDEATGKWIMFVDSDDKVAPEICEILHANACDGIMPICVHYLWKSESLSIASSNVEGYFPLKDFDIAATPSPWCKLYERKFIGDSLRFDERISFMEDALFNCVYYRSISGFFIINIPLYYYRILPVSLSHGRFVPNFIDTIMALRNARVELGKTLGLTEEEILDRGYYTNLLYSLCTAMSNTMHKDAPGKWIKKIRANNAILRSDDFKKCFGYIDSVSTKDFTNRYLIMLKLAYHTGNYFWLWLLYVPGRIKRFITRKR